MTKHVVVTHAASVPFFLESSYEEEPEEEKRGRSDFLKEKRVYDFKKEQLFRLVRL